jgi:hypothetical protein
MLRLTQTAFQRSENDDKSNTGSRITDDETRSGDLPEMFIATGRDFGSKKANLSADLSGLRKPSLEEF